MATSIRVEETTKNRIEEMRTQISKATADPMTRQRVKDATMDYLIYFAAACVVASTHDKAVGPMAEGFFGSSETVKVSP